MSLCGIAVNDANYVVKPIDGPVCSFYKTWKSMIERCYSEKYHERKPSYKDCCVCKEWLIFSNFKTWMKMQDWSNKHLDKDILGNGKLYSPETCCFIEPWLNTLLNTQSNRRGNLPIGVTKHRNKFTAHISIRGKHIYIGMFVSADEAHDAYMVTKVNHVSAMMKQYPNERIKAAVLNEVKTEESYIVPGK